jgi:lysozyme family protein
VTTTDEIIATLIDSREGVEFTDDPDDLGGPTKFGITRKTLSVWRGYPVTKAEVAALRRPEAEAILRHMFVSRFDGMPDEVRVQAVDWYVNGGNTIRTLQTLVGVEADGIIGPATRKAVAMHDPRWVARELWKARLQHMGRITRDREKNRSFIFGWINRMLGLYPDEKGSTT